MVRAAFALESRREVSEETNHAYRSTLTFDNRSIVLRQERELTPIQFLLQKQVHVYPDLVVNPQAL
jgi:hypothetical protein